MSTIECMIDAIIKGEESSVEHLIQLGKDTGIDLLNAYDHTGMTPLMHAAASNESQQLVPYLIYEGADINAQDLSGRTALHYFAMQGRIYGLSCLLHHGVMVDAVSKDDKGDSTPYDVAMHFKQYEAMKMLLAFGAKTNTAIASDVNVSAKEDQLLNPTLSSSRHNSLAK